MKNWNCRWCYCDDRNRISPRYYHSDCERINLSYDWFWIINYLPTYSLYLKVMLCTQGSWIFNISPNFAFHEVGINKIYIYIFIRPSCCVCVRCVWNNKSEKTVLSCFVLFWDTRKRTNVGGFGARQHSIGKVKL